MEKLLHYVWQHRLFPDHGLQTAHGESVDIIDTGLHNSNSGPDFFNAKIRVNGLLWIGNVEIHERASDWYRHHHETDPAFDNTVLHICTIIDTEITTSSGRVIPQLKMEIPEYVRTNYAELSEEDTYPPCYRVIPSIPPITVHAWLNTLTAERLEQKSRKVTRWLEQTEQDWEKTCFIILARNFGFGINSEAFEQWAAQIPLHAAGKHRNDLFQLEALFFGQAGLLDNEAVSPERRDDYFVSLQKEYAFLRHKFSLEPCSHKMWRFLRLRPQNFPHIRLAQLAALYHTRQTDFSALLHAPDIHSMRKLFTPQVSSYWETHYTFGATSAATPKHLQETSQDILLINTVVPMLFTYGRLRFEEKRSEQAFELLEKIKAEKNFITRSWAQAGITAAHAGDSQALIQLKKQYCDTKDCLRCRFGAEYLRKKRATHPDQTDTYQPI